MSEDANVSGSATSLATVLWIGAIPALLSIIVYANTLGNGLAYDDWWTLEALTDFDLSVRNLFQMRGLTYTVHKLDVALWGGWVPGLHITNVFLHSLASALVAVSAFAVSRSPRIGLLCGLFFAVHPVHTESVASFAYRKDILAMIFVSLALIIWIKTRRPLLRYSGTVVCYGLAVMSKEVAALPLPVMLFLADLLPRGSGDAGLRRHLRRATFRFLPFLGLGIVLVVLTVTGVTGSFFQGSRPWVPSFAVRESGPSSVVKNISEHFSPEFIRVETEEQCQDYGEVLATIAASIPEYTRLLVYPLKLSADYPPRPQRTLAAPRSVVGILLLSAWIIAALLLLKREPVASFAMAWSVVMFLPCSNVIPLIHFFVADRFLYVPSFGFCLLLAVGIDRSLVYADRRQLRWFKLSVVALTMILLAAAGLRTIIRNRDWHNEYALWSAAIHDDCNTIRARNFLGLALSRQGRYEEAIEQYQEALRMKPGYAAAQANLSRAHNNTGSVLFGQGEVARAVEHYAEAVRLDPGYSDAVNNLMSALAAQDTLDEAGGGVITENATAHNVLGLALAQQGDHDGAIAHFARALRIDPEYAEAHCNMGLALARAGKYGEAIGHYNEALRLDPDYAEAHNNLGVALAKQGHLDAAVDHYAEALRLKPDYAMAHGNLGTALAKQGRLEEAIEHLSQSLRLDPTNATTHLTLGAVLEDAGRPREAREHYLEALRLDPDHPRADYYTGRIRQLSSPK